MTIEQDPIGMRSTHPNLFRSLMTIGLVEIGLGLNFLLTTPTFQQYGIPKDLVGAVFLLLGLAHLVFLNIARQIRVVRWLPMASVAVMTFWGIGTTQSFFQGKSSLQLLVLYLGLAALQIPPMREPYLNPLAKRTDSPKDPTD